MNWKLKAVVQKTISYLPAGHKINYLFQKYVTKGVVLSEEYFFDRLTHAKAHIEAYQRHVGSLQNAVTLELGTGWYPVVPLSCFLCGASKMYSVDISSLTNKKKLLTTLHYFTQEKEKVQQTLPTLEERWKALEALINKADQLSYEQMLEALHLHLKIKDARQLNELKDHTIDLVHSNNTFEHVYEEVLEGILEEFKRLVKRGGLQSHFIDMSDHFAHSDHSITIYNFLHYSKKRWQRIDNSIQPQNRWRFKDFLELYARLDIPVTETDYRPGNLDDLAKVDVHEDFADYSKEELAISHGYIFSKGYN